MSQLPPIDRSTPLGGRYRLRDPLGEGSFAVTYLAEDLVLGRLVAVKVLRARYGGDPATAARFEREARAAAAVSSPYIVDVFDFGTDHGASYIVLQYVPGPTLRDVISQAGRLSPREAVAIAIDVLRGLAVIHDAGIVHRDVKPQNVLVDRNGTARVTDFGVALWAGTETLTSHGMAVGTAVYMAPEQALGDDVTPAADLYAVGVLLFEMLTGQPPFRGNNPTTLLMAHVHQEPPLPSDLVPSLATSVALQREVMRALAKDPGDRRNSARAMAHALEEALATDAAAAGTPFRPAADATTAAIPALGGRAEPAAATGGTVVAPAVRQKPSSRSRAWLAPLLLVVVALAALVLISVNGGFRGLSGLFDSNSGPEIAGMATAPPTTVATSTQADADGEGETISAVNEVVTATVPPAETSTVAGGGDRPLFDVSGASGPTATASTVTQPVETPTAVATSTLTPEPPPTESIAVAETPETGAAGDEQGPERSIAGGADFVVQFGPGDWQGAGEADPELGLPAVALYGSDGNAARGVLRFNLPAPPTGRMVLTLTGLGDETGMPFPFGIEVNGMYVGQSPTTFENWHPARDGLNGEQAAWDQVRINLPPEVFHEGANEIAIVSLAPGDYDDRVPYLLLSDATLAPE